MKRRLGAVAAALLFAGGTSLAFAQNKFDPGAATDVLELAKGFGSAVLSTSSDESPQIVARLNGRKYVINFYGCSKGKACQSLQFVWAIDLKNVSLDKVNEWNKAKRFAKAYIDSDGDLALDMDINLAHGVTRKNLDDSFDYWQVALKLFYKEFIE
jgi:Putative bacterial sensory transduction regulator